MDQDAEDEPKKEHKKRRTGRAVLHLSRDEVMSMVEKARLWSENPKEFQRHIKERGYVWLQMADEIAESGGCSPADIARMMKEYSVLCDRLVALEALDNARAGGARPIYHDPSED